MSDFPVPALALVCCVTMLPQTYLDWFFCPQCGKVVSRKDHEAARAESEQNGCAQ